MIKWTYAGNTVPDEQIPEEVFGFVYLVTFTDGTKYIGKKQIWMQRKLKPRKDDRKNAKRIKFYESKWREYEGSSQFREGREVATKEILHWAYNKTSLTYMEMMEQVKRDVLFDDQYLNYNILGKFYKDKL